ncbi:MAG: hypothetical protein AAGL66_07115, partial [Pseudomonadota bacterium]
RTTRAGFPATITFAGTSRVTTVRVVRELDAEREMITRLDYFADPAGQAAFFDAVDREVLAQNSFWRWALSLIYPRLRS